MGATAFLANSIATPLAYSNSFSQRVFYFSAKALNQDKTLLQSRKSRA